MFLMLTGCNENRSAAGNTKSSILTGKKFPETDEDRGDYLHIRVPSFFFTEEGESPAISLNILLKCDKSLNPQE